MTHDKLQAACFQYTWNKYPMTRRLFWHTPNEMRKYKGETTQEHIIRLSLNKAIGVVSGVFDLVFYWKGILYVFDIKVGTDRLSDNQKEFAAQVVKNGGQWFEIREFDKFKEIFDKIVLI